MVDIPGTAVTAAPAYVLRQLEPGGRWFVVDRAAKSRLRDRTNTPAPRPGVDGWDPLEAMERSADHRARYCEDSHQRRCVAIGEPPPEPWIMFVAVSHPELAGHGIGT